MLFSVGLPTGMEGLIYPLPFAEVGEIVEIARHAEALGYHSVWGNDHMTTQHYVRAEYPTPPRFWEPLITFAYAAAVTSKIKFGTGLLVLPMRKDIVVTAKQIATLDHLSRGRLEIGIGVGAYREEFEALDPDGKVHRGDMVEEGVLALRKLFTERVASFEGKYYRFKEVEFAPKPFQERFPLYFGGNNSNAIRRTALHGDGWIPAGMALEPLKASIAELRKQAAAAGRDFAKLAVAPQFICRIGTSPEQATAEFRQSQLFKHLISLSGSTLKDQGDVPFEASNLIGSADQIVAKALAMREAGVTHLLGILFAANDLADLRNQMQMFAELVIPKIAA